MSLHPTTGVQGNLFATSVAPPGSVWFTAETVSSVGNDHGILANLDPVANLVRTWDLDTRLGLATGQGANLLDQDVGNVWITAPAAVVHRLDPVGLGQWTWSLPVNPINSTIRGMRRVPSGSLMVSLESTTGPGSILKLNATTNTLTTFSLPTETAPFGGDVAPDGVSYWFCEFFTKRLAMLNTQTGELAEYLLPTSASPFQLFVADDGTVWFVDGVEVGHFNPASGALVLYSKADLSPQWAAPIPTQNFQPLVALADGQPFVDILCATPEEAVFLPETGSTLSLLSQPITPAPSRPNFAVVELVPAAMVVSPIDPGEFARYATETPTLAVAEHRGSVYATGANLLESIFRFYQLTVCGLRP